MALLHTEHCSYSDAFRKRLASLSSPEQVWRQVLDELGLQMPPTTFDAWLRDTRLMSVEDGIWRIAVSTPQAQQWLSSQLYSLVKHAFDSVLSHHGKRPASLQFVAAASGSARPAEDAPLRPNEVAYQFVDFDLYDRGWLKVPHYYELYWQPVLGYPAYSFWRYQQLVNWTRHGNYTRGRIIDLSRAAAHVGVDRKILKGPKGGQIGGALAELRNHGIGNFQVHGQGRHTSYSGRVLRTLPLLSPAQAEVLPAPIQDEHARWLVDAGFDLDRWYSISQPTLAGETSSDLETFARPDWGKLEHLGYLVSPSYYDLFLQPLLKSAGYGIWRLLKCLYYAPRERYTRERRITIDEISSRLRCHRQAITGCNRRRDGQRYWQPGVFDIMQEHRIAGIKEEGSGRQRTYRIRALNSPQILTPSQVDRLPAVLHDAHDIWIERARLDLEAWRQLELPILSDQDDVR
jgi:hypothetical protein